MWMTIEIDGDLLARVKRVAMREGKTLRQFVEEALRQRLDRTAAPSPFRLTKHTFAGRDRRPPVAEGQWEIVRDLIYRLRSG